jgi:hypothetical protein
LLVKHNDLITQIATCYQVFAHVNDFNTFLNNKDFPDKGTRQVQRVKNSIRQKIEDDKEESQGWLKDNMEDIKDAYMNETGTTHHAILETPYSWIVNLSKYNTYGDCDGGCDGDGEVMVMVR